LHDGVFRAKWKEGNGALRIPVASGRVQHTYVGSRVALTFLRKFN
jgi:hypothetical protein